VFLGLGALLDLDLGVSIALVSLPADSNAFAAFRSCAGRPDSS